MFLKNRNFSSKIKRSKVTDYAALSLTIVASLERSERGNISVFISRKCQIRVKSRDSRTFSRNSLGKVERARIFFIILLEQFKHDPLAGKSKLMATPLLATWKFT